MFEMVFSVPYYGLDMNDRVKTGLMLQFLQEAAALHADSVNIGVGNLMKRDMTWVLRRYRVRIHLYPGKRSLSVRTWFEPQRNLMSVRVFEIRDDIGNVVADAWSAWIVVDLKRGRPVRLDRALTEEYFSAAEPTGEPVTDELAAMKDDFDFKTRFRVRWGELDLNGHTNHTVYFDWALESAPDGVREHYLPSVLDAEYISPVPRGDVTVRTKKISDDPLKFSHVISAGASDTAAARLATVWRPDTLYSART
ncbi:MAG: hypothetical protein LBQ58_02440 [Synergistaceae bacterium]|jgi:acyl-ACP thioesterase|nr:hypothetical protein [Synergistaceae bacterium]